VSFGRSWDVQSISLSEIPADLDVFALVDGRLRGVAPSSSGKEFLMIII
jgi:hypothetical protein